MTVGSHSPRGTIRDIQNQLCDEDASAATRTRRLAYERQQHEQDESREVRFLRGQRSEEGFSESMSSFLQSFPLTYGNYVHSENNMHNENTSSSNSISSHGSSRNSNSTTLHNQEVESATSNVNPGVSYAISDEGNLGNESDSVGNLTGMRDSINLDRSASRSNIHDINGTSTSNVSSMPVVDVDDSVDDGNDEDEEQRRRDDENAAADAAERTIMELTRRLRCLFGILTWPIVPMGTVVMLALSYFLYAAAFLDLDHHTSSIINIGDDGADPAATTKVGGGGCSHPVRGYAVATVLVAVYAPYHALIRDRFFNYRRERDGPNRPVMVRRYDQIIHTIALLYVYAGITLVETCREDTSPLSSSLSSSSSSPFQPSLQSQFSSPFPRHDVFFVSQPTQQQQQSIIEMDHVSSNQTIMNMSKIRNDQTPFVVDSTSDSFNGESDYGEQGTCHATCPNLTAALTIYVATLELFTLSLIIPLLLLPCIYLWFLRHAAANREALRLLHERFQNEDDLDMDEQHPVNEQTMLLFGSTGTGGATATTTAEDILSQFQVVKLIRRRSQKNTTKKVDRNGNEDDASIGSTHDSSTHEIWIVPQRKKKSINEMKNEKVTHGGNDHHDFDDSHDNDEVSISSTTSSLVGGVSTRGTVLNNSSYTECCICMCDFCIQSDHEGENEDKDEDNVGEKQMLDIETGQRRNNKGDVHNESNENNDHVSCDAENDLSVNDDNAIVRTHACKHLFHKRCIAGWISGRWQFANRSSGNNTRSSGNMSQHQQRRARLQEQTQSQVQEPTHINTRSGGTASRNRDWSRIRARRTTCPLCRQDLRPVSGTRRSGGGGRGSNVDHLPSLQSDTTGEGNSARQNISSYNTFA